MAHYYSEKQTSSLRLRKINVSLRGVSAEFYTGSGVFSFRKIDRGTAILIEYCVMKKDWRILDIGCGYGVVGIIIAKAFPEAEVVMTDINKRAVKLAKMNCELNQLFNAEVKQGDLFEKVEGEFDTILVNPPQVAGKDVCFKIIENAKKYLYNKGLLQLVARHNKGGKVMSDRMKEVFGNVQEIAKKSGYRVYVSQNGKKQGEVLQC
jgi:16S rRNA G1207 methylase RsmC